MERKAVCHWALWSLLWCLTLMSVRKYWSG